MTPRLMQCKRMRVVRYVRAQWIVAALCLVASHAKAQVDYADAYVERAIVQFRFPLADAGPRRGNGVQATGYYAWRIIIEDRSDESFAIVTDTLMRTDDVKVIARESRLRRCGDPGALSVLSCAIPVAGKIDVYEGTLRVTISDSVFVRRMQRVRPVNFVLYAMQPGGRFQARTIPFVYRLPPLPSPNSQQQRSTDRNSDPAGSAFDSESLVHDVL